MPRIYPIGSGKGGAGKSFITANLGVLLSKQGKRVVLVDLDLGGSNLHTFLEHQGQKIDLNDFLNKAIKSRSRCFTHHHSKPFYYLFNKLLLGDRQPVSFTEAKDYQAHSENSVRLY